MVETSEFDFTGIVINVVSQKPELNPSPEDIKKYFRTNEEGFPVYDLVNADKMTKLTVGDLLMRYFDVVAFTKASQLGNYSGIVNQINQAKKDRKKSIDITKEEKKGLIDVFSIPPKEPKLNSSYMFIVNYLEKKIESTKTPKIKKS